MFNTIPDKVKEAQEPRKTYNHITIPKAVRFSYQKKKAKDEEDEEAHQCEHETKPEDAPARPRSRLKRPTKYLHEKEEKDHLKYHLLHIKRMQDE